MAWARVHPHFIVQHLEDLEDVIAARQTCSLLASVRAEYLLEEVAVAYHRDKFNALLAIADHPVMAKKVQSLHFQADRFKPGVTYEEWDKQRPDPAPPGIEEAIKEDDHGTSERAQRFIVRAYERSWREKRQRIKRVPLDEKRLA